MPAGLPRNKIIMVCRLFEGLFIPAGIPTTTI
jgi:hypothetical protein